MKSPGVKHRGFLFLKTARPLSLCGIQNFYIFDSLSVIFPSIKGQDDQLLKFKNFPHERTFTTFRIIEWP